MKNVTFRLFTSTLLILLITSSTIAQTMERQSFTAKGPFKVKMTPQGQNTTSGSITMGTYLVEKVFSGDLEATSKFEMHTAGTDAGAAAYVALEVITGTLGGKTGSFLLTHAGTMTKTDQQLALTIAPESASGELKGLEGTFKIVIENKEHFYVMEYSLPK